MIEILETMPNNVRYKRGLGNRYGKDKDCLLYLLKKIKKFIHSDNISNQNLNSDDEFEKCKLCSFFN